MLVFLFFPRYRRRFSKVYAYLVLLTEWGSVEQLSDFYRGFDGGVGYYDSAEGAEGGEGVERCGRAQEGVDVLKVLGEKCGEGIEILRSG